MVSYPRGFTNGVFSEKKLVEPVEKGECTKQVAEYHSGETLSSPATTEYVLGYDSYKTNLFEDIVELERQKIYVMTEMRNISHRWYLGWKIWYNEDNIRVGIDSFSYTHHSGWPTIEAALIEGVKYAKKNLLKKSDGETKK